MQVISAEAIQPESAITLSPAEEAELIEAIVEADRGDTVSAEELFARLRRQD